MVRRHFIPAVLTALGIVVAAEASELRVADKTAVLTHRMHRATWSEEGLRFEPRTGPSWEWELRDVRLGGCKVDLDHAASPSADRERLTVHYERGPLVEQYLCGPKSIEQRFVIPRALGVNEDLVIEGAIRSSGHFSATANGWMWRNSDGVVSLGDVTVFDRNGARLTATMDVTADGTRITVAAESLARAAYPVTIDPEIGADFRISFMGLLDDPNTSADNPDVAFNSTDNEFLVVWSGRDSGGEFEIYGQLIDGPTRLLIGSQFKISQMGGTGNTTYTAREPAVAYNATNNEYLVVWWGDNNVGSLADNEWEIWGQRISAAGAENGADFRISYLGTDGSTTYLATSPDVAWDSTNNRYLVVWEGQDPSIVAGGPPVPTGETEVWGRVLTSTGTSFSADDTRLSAVGLEGDTTRYALDPAVAFDSTNARYLVVWTGDDAADNATDAYGQLVTAAGAESGSDFRISDMGNTDTDPTYRADNVAVAFNATSAEYLVVWRGDDEVVGDDAYDIFGQRVSAAGVPLAPNDFIISDMGLPGSTANIGDAPSVAWSPAVNEFLVAWQGDDDVDGNTEIHVQRVNSTGPVGDNDVRISTTGDTSINYWALESSVAWGADGRYLVVFRADSLAGFPDAHWEVYGQFYSVPSPALTTISANPTSIASDGVSTSTITVQAKDTAGNNMTVSAGSVALMTDRGSLGPVTNHGNGTYTATLTSSSNAGTATITGTLDGVAIGDNATVDFIFPAPANLVAAATTTSSVALTWTAVAGATSYDIYRATVIPGYSFLASVATNSHNDTGLDSTQTYVYIVRAVKTSATSAFSAPDAATTISFTDQTLNSSVVVKALHLTQLRTAVNAMRAAANLAAASFTDSTVTAGVTPVKGVHILEARTALDAARTAIGLPGLGYTDVTITPGTTVIKAAHVTEVRQGTQ